MAAPVTPVLVVTGPVGAGKTTVALAIADLLDEGSVPHAFIDMDALRSCSPRPPGDPFQIALGLRNLADVWRNCREAGAERLVLADVVETRDRSGFQRAIPGAAIAVARLVAAPATIERRLRARESGAALAWHLRRAVELAALMEERGIGDLVIATDDRPPRQIAQEILRRAGWPPSFPQDRP